MDAIVTVPIHGPSMNGHLTTPLCLVDVTEFATWGQKTRHTLNAEQAKLLVQNVQEMDLLAFDSDKKLLQDLMEFHVSL